MKRVRNVIVVALFSLQIQSALAVDPSVDDFQRFLVPVTTPVDPGIARWEADLWIYNNSTEFVKVTAHPESKAPCPIECVPTPAAPGKTQVYSPWHPAPFGGVFVYVAADGVDDIHMSVRTQEWGSQGQGGGTEIPIVSEQDVAMNETVHLIRVPCDDRFRRLLRVYSFDGADTWAVIRIVGTGSGEVLEERVHELRRFPPGLEGEVSELFPPYPPYVQIPVDASVCGEDFVRVEIQPLNPNDRLWGMISLTNNQTQHVTLVTPQP